MTESLTEKEQLQFKEFGKKVENLKHSKCESWKSKLMKSSPIIQFLIQELERIGKPIDTQKIVCLPCGKDRAGGFAPNYGIVLCENQLQSRQHLEDTLAHELIHAYDNSTVKLDWSNPNHLACTEIRAANLSKECAFTREIQRGYFAIAKHHQACVKRRAILGIMQAGFSMNEAKVFISRVWEPCFNDTAPFDEIF